MSHRHDDAGKTAVMQNIQGTARFLERFAPFNQMEAAHLAYLVEHCRLRFYSQGEAIILPEQGPVEHCYIVKQGRVHGQRTAANGQPETTFEIGAGECFALAALMGERATRTAHLAAEDTFCLLLSKEAFVRLFALSTPLRDFALRGVSSLLDQVNQQIKQRAAEHLSAQVSLDTPLADIALRAPVSCAPETPLREAVRIMHEQHVGSIVAVDAEQRPDGIFTLRDLRRVVAEGLDLDQPLSMWMTPNPFSLPPIASAFDAALAMTERHIAHVCLVENGRLCAMVSERDLFSLQRVDLVHLARTIRHAASLQSLSALRHDVSQLAERMLAHGASSSQITQLITLLNDHTVSRVIELVLAEHGDPGISFTWLCFGSEGRREQTLHTDQDNGILFETDSSANTDAIRQRLLPVAQRINQALADCGFTLCPGNIMAGNPQLCLSRQEWQQRFTRLISAATPENLLASSIYFDLRAVWGSPEPCEALRRGLLEQIAGNLLFQRMMAANALHHRPPVGRLRDFVLQRSGADKHTLDLKTQGLTPFVDGARLLALANGISATNTLERLQALSACGALEAQDGAAFEEAYHFIQQTRLQQHHLQAREGRPYSNRLDPDTLNLLDRRILRESLRQAQRLQSSLALRYQL